MKLFLSPLLPLTCFVVAVKSTAISLDKRTDILDVVLSSVGNTILKATITNRGSKDLNLFNKGTFLDSGAVEKVSVSSSAGRVPFLGIRKRVKTSNLTESAFTHISAGQTLEVTLDVATVHDLSVGGTFTVSSFGAIPYAPHGSTTLSNEALIFNSNELEVKVDGAQAAKIKRTIQPLDKRTKLQSDCSGVEGSNTRQALANCQQLATVAAGQASTGSASKFQEYFMTTAASVRGTVAARFRAVANECSSSSSGATTSYCTDVYGACDGNTLAYTSPVDNIVVNCPIYFQYLPVLSRTCHDQDMTTTTLHEFTHAPAVFSPGTEDYAYGYSAARSLTSARAVLNADTYALYANAIYAGC
ncbi:hypothetical protein EJ08DRAFT_116987 [Tothia fuscella]|uniref:Neutral protease 2 n=1 Tax=Tothia fuscella TaxID=1048955 RepID=A0A9P4NV33_9PEZI|nr:hypothetical protein EJ08DRAFT_116987 [Tothia fuscella]